MTTTETAEQIQDANERDQNDVIDVLWPMLDAGKSKSDVMELVHNALDAWTPANNES